jgi:hypothetical protein
MVDRGEVRSLGKVGEQTADCYCLPLLVSIGWLSCGYVICDMTQEELMTLNSQSTSGKKLFIANCRVNTVNQIEI